MDSQTLRTFLTLAKLQNFTKTADAMFLAQSTVTNRIAELEGNMGQKLFIRNRRGVRLSPEGLAFLPYATRILELEEASIRELNSLNRHEVRLRIGTTNTIYECYLADNIKNFHRSNPEIALKITMGHSEELLLQLQDQLLDRIYTYVPLFKKGYCCITYATDRLLLVTDASNSQYEKGITRAELPESEYLFCNFALQDVGLMIRELFPAHYEFGFEIDNSTKLIPYLLESEGISFLPESLALPYIQKEILHEIPLVDFSSPLITCYEIYRESSLLPVL